MMAEFGAMNAYLPPDQTIFDYLASRRTSSPPPDRNASLASPPLPEGEGPGVRVNPGQGGEVNYTPLYPDPDANYEDEYHLDVSALEPQIALPHQPDNVVNLSEAVGQPVQQAFIGTCTNGRYEDLQAAASVLRGQKVRCRLVVIPASSQVLLQATQSGVLATLLEAGATIGTPGCGPCMGNHMGVPAPDEATISSANRNFRGRMGTPDAPVYLASPYVVAASAIHAAIADPRQFLDG
jgi:homoaconitase/3-isopropylmalate dehydratase large subunit